VRGLLRETLVLFLLYALFLLFNFKGVILNFYPVADLWVILSHSQSFEPVKWFTEGFRDYFTFHGELSHGIYNYLRPVYNFLTWLLYEAGGKSLFLLPLAGLLVYAFTSAWVYYFTLRFVAPLRLPALLLSLTFFTYPAGLSLSVSWDFAQDVIAFFTLLLTLTAYLSGRKALAFFLGLVGLFTKEQFLLVPVMVGLREAYFKNFRWAFAFLGEALFYAGLKLFLFGALGAEGTVGFERNALTKVLVTPLNLLLLNSSLFTALSPSEALKALATSSSFLDKAGVFLNLTALFLLLAGLVLRKVSPFFGTFALVYDLFPLLVKAPVGSFNERFLIYGKFFTLLSLVQLFRKKPLLLNAFLASVLLFHLYQLFIWGGVSGIARKHENFRKFCREVVEELRACEGGGKVFLIGSDVCFMYGIKGVPEVAGLKGELVPLLNFRMSRPQTSLSFKDSEAEIFVKAKTLGEFLYYTLNVSLEKVKEKAKREGRLLVLEKGKVRYEVVLAEECKELREDCKIEGVRVVVKMGEGDRLFFWEDERRRCVSKPTSPSTE